MNIERYILPVAIAVGLHGALLFLGGGDPPIRTIDEKPPVSPPPVPFDLVEPPDPSGGDGGAGNAEPLPSQPDIPDRVSNEDIFKIVVSPTITAPLNPVLKLPANPIGSLGGDEFGGPIGKPRLPSSINLDRIPRATVRPAPVYPAAMRDISGSVTVEFVVDTTGRVVSAEAVKWTHREFVDSAVRAVLQWRFEPGTINHRKVSFRMAIPIEFNAER